MLCQSHWEHNPLKISRLLSKSRVETEDRSSWPKRIPRSIDFADELALRPFVRFFEKAKIKGCDNTRVGKGVEPLCNYIGKPSGAIYWSYSSPYLMMKPLHSWVHAHRKWETRSRDVDGSNVCNSPKLEIIQMSIDKRMNTFFQQWKNPQTFSILCIMGWLAFPSLNSHVEVLYSSTSCDYIWRQGL